MENKKCILIEITGNGYIVHTKNLFAAAPSSTIATNIKAAVKITETILESQKDFEDSNHK